MQLSPTDSLGVVLFEDDVRVAGRSLAGISLPPEPTLNGLRELEQAGLVTWSEPLSSFVPWVSSLTRRPGGLEVRRVYGTTVMASYDSLSVVEQNRFNAITFHVTDKGKTARSAIAAAVAAQLKRDTTT
jgi:hypothetical protein